MVNGDVISNIHQEYARFGNFVLTKSGSLIGAIEIDGRDPDGLGVADFEGLSAMAQASMYQKLPERTIVTQYFIHTDGGEVSFKKRLDRVCNRLTQTRADYLNKRSLSVSRIVHFIEIPPEETLIKLGFVDQVKHLFMSPFQSDSRQALKAHFSSTEIILLVERQLLDMEEQLADICDEFSSKWEGLLSPRALSIDESWKYMKFISNLDPHYLHDSCSAVAPETRFDGALSDGDVSNVMLGSLDVVKFANDTPTYASIYAINNFGGDRVVPGMWAAGDDSPISMKGNYMLMVRFRKNTSFQTAWMFNSKKGQIDRQQFDISSVLGGSQTNYGELEKRQLMKKSIKDALEGLDEAEALDIHWGVAHGCAVTWASTSDELRQSRKRLKVSMEQSGFSCCWEGVGIMRAYKALQPGGFDHSLRNVEFNTAQLSAASLLYRSSEGQRVIPDLDGEEALYVFQAADGSPFYYSPWVGGRNLVIGVGPIRSGKSFTKNTLASHFSKYGGFLQGIDVDVGMEPVAKLFGNDGGIFKTSSDEIKGFNPFISCTGADDVDFYNHLKTQIMMMLSTNDSLENQTLTAAEQASLDAAIHSTMKMPEHLQRLATVHSHCSSSLKGKLARWVDTGINKGAYSEYFDAPVDSVGAIDKRVMAYNLMGIKDNTAVLPIVMSEIFFRVTRIFLDAKNRSLPKYLDIDECKTLFMSSPDAVGRIVKIIRTMGKYQGGVGLWTQNVADYSDLDDWDALRSAASTFFFMADPEMNPEAYKSAFHLSDGECAAIQSLTPKREAFIVQRELGVAKKILLDVDLEQYFVSTSRASDVAMRDRFVEQYGYEAGMRKSVANLKEKQREQRNKRVAA